MTPTLMLAQSAVFLVSFWKALLILPPFVAWAWLISSRLDKDARHYHLNHRLWNGIHLAAGVVGLVATLAIPFFFIGWFVGMLILAGPILAYWKIRNDAVPEFAQFHLSGANLSEAMEARRQRKAMREALIQFTGPDGTELPVPMKEDPLLPTHVLCEDLIGPAVSGRATRLEVQLTNAGGKVFQTIDGVRYPRQVLPTDATAAMIDYLKKIARLDLQDRRRRQTGSFSMHGSGGNVPISITTEGSLNGQLLTLEFDRAKRMVKPFDGLGLLPPQLEALRVLEQQPERHGVVLLGAPRGHGLSTSSYSFLNRHDAYTSNIKTLEREILTEIDGVDQVLWDPNNPAVDYATNLQSILRRDPDIVLTAELADAESARVASGPALAGPLLYVPQRLGTITEQINAWVNLVGDVKQATRALRAVVNQRLLRSLCPNCRQSYQPAPEQVKKLNLSPDRVKQLYRVGGKVQVKNKIEPCPVCAGTGYLGQTGAFEVFMVDDEARRLLAARDLKGALAHARRNKMILLQEAALSKALRGETTLEEVARVTAPPQPRPARDAGARPPQRDPAATPT